MIQLPTRDEALILLKRAHEEPIFFADRILNAGLWSKQARIFNAVFKYPRVAVKSCHASGKSYLAAAAALAFVHIYYPASVIITAPVGRQVQHVVWKEIFKLIGKSTIPLGGEPLSTIYRLDANSFIVGATTDDPEKLQGYHNENILCIVDEASGVADDVMNAIDSLLAGGNAHLLILGNPARNEGFFYRAFNDVSESKLYKKFTISAFDTPNVQSRQVVIPGLVTWKWVKERKRVWGFDHPLYKIKVLGEFPTSTYSNLVIPPYLIDIAKENEVEVKRNDKIILGIDVGEYGQSETAVAVRKGNKLLNVFAWSVGNMEAQRNRIIEIVCMYPTQMVEIRIDRIGIGYGLYEELRKFAATTKGQVSVIGYDVRERPTRPELYFDTRTECWMEFRNMLAEKGVDFYDFDRICAEKDRLYMELTTPKYSVDDKSRYRLEASKDILRRIDHFDRATAVVLAFYDVYQSQNRIVTPPSPYLLRDLERPVAGYDYSDVPWRTGTV